MIEMRPKISGFYKGIVYCSSAEEAYQIADYLETIIKNNIRPGLPALVKRGCSEYSFPYPDFKKINRCKYISHHFKLFFLGVVAYFTIF